MTPAETLPAVDRPPADGVWRDHDDVFSSATPEEIAEGNRLGAAIDVDDDLDDGGVELIS